LCEPIRDAKGSSYVKSAIAPSRALIDWKKARFHILRTSGLALGSSPVRGAGPTDGRCRHVRLVRYEFGTNNAINDHGQVNVRPSELDIGRVVKRRPLALQAGRPLRDVSRAHVAVGLTDNDLYFLLRRTRDVEVRREANRSPASSDRGRHCLDDVLRV
jgi:hypothetical protein